MNTPNRNDQNQAENSATGSMKSNIAMLLFGLVTLFYLVAIDHEEWFHMRHHPDVRQHPLAVEKTPEICKK